MTSEVENPNEQKPNGEKETMGTQPSFGRSQAQFWGGGFYNVLRKQMTSTSHKMSQDTGESGMLPSVSDELKPDPQTGQGNTRRSLVGQAHHQHRCPNATLDRSGWNPAA